MATHAFAATNSPPATHAGTEAAGGHAAAEASFPPFDPANFAPQLVWLAITFGLLYWLMSRIALPRVADILESRSARIAADIGEAERLRSEAQTAGAAYEKSLNEARSKAKAIAQEMRDTLAAESEGRRRTLEAELHDRLAASEATIRTKTTDAMSNVRGIAAETAAAIVERLTGHAPDGRIVEAALDRTLADRG